MERVKDEGLARLEAILRKTEGCAVAFSGGVDSSFVLTVARQVLGDKCLAVIADAPVLPRVEFNEALDWVKERGIPYSTIDLDVFAVDGFPENPPDRCYHCKKAIFGAILAEASRRGFSVVVDGTNADDCKDYRPGLRALAELGVLSPLKEAKLAKADVRRLSREVYDLPTADNPSMACLASRVPYGSPITKEKLAQVEAVEGYLREAGFRIFRARHHDTILRLELGPFERKRLEDPELLAGLVETAKALGFLYVTLDLEGYRMGSLNEGLGSRDR